MKIGFNACHSAKVFLQNNKDLTLKSFDIGYYDYLKPAKEYIDATYPNRHTLILGDSRVSIPKYIENNKENNPTIKFDVIFIDSGYDYDVANADMSNCFNLAHKDTVVILDDTMFTKGWEQCYTVGPTRVWNENLEKNKIVELMKKDYFCGREMSWGKYVF